MDIADRLKREIARKSDLDRDKALLRDALREIERLRRSEGEQTFISSQGSET